MVHASPISGPAHRADQPEEWPDFGFRELQNSSSGEVCMTCQHFKYSATKQYITLLSCPLHQCLIPQGEHLNKKCPQWLLRRELEVGWCPEAA